MTSLYDCVKAGKYVRDDVKMEKNLRGCVIGHPPGGPRMIDCFAIIADLDQIRLTSAQNLARFIISKVPSLSYTMRG